jgi:hypothetical protein
MAACLLCLELSQPSIRVRAEDVEPESSVEATAEPVATGSRVPEESALRASTLLQVDAVPYAQGSVDELDPATRQPLNQERFSIARAWVRMAGHYGLVRGLVIVEGSTRSGPAMRLLATEVGLSYPTQKRPPTAEAALGLFNIPFGAENQELAPRRMFLEPATWVNAIFPGRRDLGLRVAGSYAFVRGQLAVMNGNPSGSAALPVVDPNHAKDVLGRLGAHGKLLGVLDSALGVSGLLGTGFHAGTAPTMDTLTARDVNGDGIVQTSEIQLVAGSPGEPSANFARAALGVDASVAYGLFDLGQGRVDAELIVAKNADRASFVADPVSSGRNFWELGLTLALRQLVTRHAELGLRYDLYDGDRDASTRLGSSVVPTSARVTTWTLAAAFCTYPSLRVTLQYARQHNPFGRDLSGAPTTRAADVLTLRAQWEP